MTSTKPCNPAVSTSISTLFFPLEPADAFQQHMNPLLKNKANRRPGPSTYKLKDKKRNIRRGCEGRGEEKGGERMDEEKKMKTVHIIKCPVCSGLNVNFSKGSVI